MFLLLLRISLAVLKSLSTSKEHGSAVKYIFARSPMFLIQDFSVIEDQGFFQNYWFLVKKDIMAPCVIHLISVLHGKNFKLQMMLRILTLQLLRVIIKILEFIYSNEKTQL